MRTPDRRLSPGGFLSALVLGFALLLAAATLAPNAQASATYELSSLSNTTAAPGDDAFHYYLNDVNIGDDTSFGQLTLRASFPPGMQATEVESTGSVTPWDCSANVFPTALVTCTNTATRTALGYPQIESNLTHSSALTFTVSIAPGASGTIAPSFELWGDGTVTRPDGSACGLAPPEPPCASLLDPTPISTTLPAFGFEAVDGAVESNSAGDAYTNAGGTPYRVSTWLSFNTYRRADPLTGGENWPVEPIRDVIADLPPGLVGAVPGIARCKAFELAHTDGLAPQPLCPAESQVGVADVLLDTGATAKQIAVYNVDPPPGIPARFGFSVQGSIVTLDASLRSDSDYGLSVSSRNLSQVVPVAGTRLIFWGVPSASAHDHRRMCPDQLEINTGGQTCASATASGAFLRLPTSCTSPGEGLRTTFRADSWTHPGVFVSAGFESHLPPSYPTPPGDRGPAQGPTDCGDVPFEPSIAVSTTTNQAASPSGVVVDLSLPQDSEPGSIKTADLKEAVVQFPPGMTLNPSSADGLGACSAEQIGLIGTGFPAPNPIHFDLAEPSCPDSSKLGTVAIATPLLEEELQGSVYLAAQGDNPFGSLVALYIVVKGPGVILKLPGLVEARPDGQLITRFENQPQLPFEALHLELFGGSRAPLRTPAACGSYATEAELTPWSGNASADLKSSFQITSGPAGSPCPSGAFDPKLSAGSTEPLAGAFTSFSLRISRADGTPELTSLSATLPPGLIGRLAGISYCPESALAAVSEAEGSGERQLASPSCPLASQVGKVTVLAGAGPTPLFLDTAKVYLAGPYKGAPLSLAVIAPAVAGPFDLGTVLVRNALRVDPESARVSALSDPIPTHLHGIALDLRDIRISVNRPNFILNPTSCDPMAITAQIAGVGGTSADRSDRFQVANCASLPFKPRLSLRLKGSTKRTSNPKLIANLKARPGDANIARAQVKLPKAAFLDNSHIGTVCTRVQFAAGRGGGEGCPPGSIYGRASATSPLLDYAVSGPVYLRSSNHTLPDLVVALRGPESQPIEIDLAGRTDSVKGALRNTFEAVPDAPVSTFHLELFGGKKGLIEMSSGLCAHPRATVKLDGQNGKVRDFKPVVRADCGKGKRKAHNDNFNKRSPR